jgi:hypothetical protein
MKWTKEKLIEIIKEEMGSIEDLTGDNTPDDVSSRSELGDKLKKTGIEIKKAQSIDGLESQAIEQILSLLIQSAQDGNSKPELQRLLKIATDRLMQENLIEQKDVKNKLKQFFATNIKDPNKTPQEATKDFLDDIRKDAETAEAVGEEKINLINDLADKMSAQTSKEDAAEVVVAALEDNAELPSDDGTNPEVLPKLQQAFKQFSNDDKGFMKVGYLREQDAMLGELRSALRQFIGLEGLETALKEQEEQNLLEQPTNDKTKGSREKLIKDVGRYRRDLNNTGEILGQYLTAAQSGLFKAQPILNKLKIELQKIQDNNVVIIKDLKRLTGIKENLLTEEETREEKIAKVEAAYNKIVDLLRPTLQTRTISEPSPNDEKNEAIVFEEITPTESELQSFANNVSQALEEIEGIKKYFRVTGTFNRPLDEVRNDFLEYVKGYKDTMSDLVVDLRQGTPSPQSAAQYAGDFARLAKKIQDDFGISPAEVISVPDAPKVLSVTEIDVDDTPAVNPSPAAAEVVAQTPNTEGPTLITDINDYSKLMFSQDNISTQKLRQIFNFNTSELKYLKPIRRLLLSMSLLKNSSVPNKEEPEELQEESTRQKLTRIGTSSGYSTGTIQGIINKINNIEDPELKSLYNEVLDAFGVLEDKQLNNLFQLMKKFEDDLGKEEIKINFEGINDKVNNILTSPINGKSVKLEVKEKINNILERLVKEELKVLNGKKMVCN